MKNMYTTPGVSIKQKIDIDAQEFPRIAVNALKTLSYKQDLYDRHDDKIIYVDPHDICYGSDRWRCLFQALITWQQLPGEIDVNVTVSEKQYGPTYEMLCLERNKAIWQELRKNIERFKTRKAEELHWRARFVTGDDLQKANYTLGENKEASRLLIGRLDNKKIWAPKEVTNRHQMLIGRTGSGKTYQVIIPQALERVNESAIFTEAVSGNGQPVVYSKTAGLRKSAGHEIIYFNPGDLKSTRINPIDLVRSFDDAQHLANLIVQNTTSDTHFGDDVWAKSETHLLQALILHVAGFRADLRVPSKVGDNANLGYIRRLLRLGPDGMEGELSQSRLRIARQEFAAYMNSTSPNFRCGVISGLTQRLNLFANPRIAALTEVTDFDISKLKNKLFSVYLATPVHRQEYGPLAALMFNFFLSVILRDIEDLKHPLMLLLDEFTNFGYLPAITRYTTVIRNAGIGALFGVQSMAQLEKLYREKDAKILFSQAATKIFFATDGDEALVLSRMLGNTTVKESVNASGGLSNRESPSPLLDVADIANLERDGEYLVITTAGPIKLKKLPIWNIYQDAMERPCPERQAVVVNEELEIANVDNEPPVIQVPKQKPANNERQNGQAHRPKNPHRPSGNLNNDHNKTKDNYWSRFEESARAASSNHQEGDIPQTPSDGKPINNQSDLNVNCAVFRIELEKRLLKIAAVYDPEIEKKRMTAGALLELVRQQNLLSAWESGFVREFIKTLNKGVHGRSVDPEFMQWISNVGPQVIEALDKRISH